jgi:HPt (histidine-containing phosphotransfer) domain-containing protein
MSDSRPLYIRSARDLMALLGTLPAQFQAAVASDRGLAALQMHSLKGTAALLGAGELSRLAQSLEALCRTECHASEISAQAAHLASLAQHTGQALARVVAQLECEHHATAPPQCVSPWSVAALRGALEEVVRLLQTSDLSVLDRLEALRPPLRGALAGRAESMDQLDAAMQRLDLVRALQACQNLQQALARMAG